MFDVKGKWVLITGSSRGIGKLSAEFLAGMKANLILHSRKLSHTSDLKEELEKYGIEVRCVEAELDDLAAVEKMLKEIDEMGVDVDVVLNNAGYQVTYMNDYFSTRTDEIEQSFRINTIAPLMIVYHFLPKMIERGSGRIVNTTSGIALQPEQAGYSASKAALDKLTIDLGSKINGTDVMMNLTDPGWCRTDLGGPNAPNAPETAVPGVLAGVFADDGKSGRLLPAQDYTGMSIEEMVRKAESVASPY